MHDVRTFVSELLKQNKKIIYSLFVDNNSRVTNAFKLVNKNNVYYTQQILSQSI